MSDSLEVWLEEHHNPAWKYRAPTVPKMSLRKFSRADVAWDMKEYAYSFGFDYRTITEPVTLAEFIQRKSDPKYKAWQLPKRRATTVPKLSAKARAAESAMIARYVSSRSA